MIRVRFAPSPTGFLHIGGARTALFNWMYARNQSGKFILRIEDTDRERSKKEYLDEILDSMAWLGLKWDEFYLQSERFDVYKNHAEKLISEDKAYRDGQAVILKIPQKIIKLFDLIRGEIEFDSATIKDQVLMKSDGSPTYSFACVIDDALMEISHVVRGEDHISNTPKQILIYEALGLKIPKFAHLPLILDTEGGRMSKRTGATAVTEYRKMGFLPGAIVNYLMLLGWSPGEQEVVKLDDAVKKFSIKKVNKTAAAFSMDKLDWINEQHIKRMDTGALTDQLLPLLIDKGYAGENFDRKRLEGIVRLFQPRMTVLPDFLDWTGFLFLEKPEMEPEAQQKYLSDNKSREFNLLAERLEKIEPYDVKSTEIVFRGLVEDLGLNASDLVHPVRVALTGKAIGPGLFDTMVLLGRDKTVRRLRETFLGTSGTR